jgi:hypothetical protein
MSKGLSILLNNAIKNDNKMQIYKFYVAQFQNICQIPANKYIIICINVKLFKVKNKLIIFINIKILNRNYSYINMHINQR